MKTEKRRPPKAIKWCSWFLFLLSLKEVGPLVKISGLHKYTLGFVWCCCLKWKETIQSALTTTIKMLSCSYIICVLTRRIPRNPSQIWSPTEQGMQDRKRKPILGSQVTQWRSTELELGGLRDGWERYYGTCGLGSSILKIICKISRLVISLAQDEERAALYFCVQYYCDWFSGSVAAFISRDLMSANHRTI